jgi:hypothetical protein
LGSQSADSITRDILSYLAKHPKAQDTLEGIVEWWLLEQKIKRWQAQVQKALDELVEQGLVIRSRSEDRRERYRANNRKLAEIRRLLAGDRDVEPRAKTPKKPSRRKD